MCRTELPPGPENLHDDAIRRYLALKVQLILNNLS